ncbi:hypothetical protein [Endozoicomonas sp. Mp262]|uniref:hypothetical protein n=1 Tax=Endozoicomonas sp. Mp262 TaxID=2919499 RepID=UPI0021D7DF57
MNKIKFMFLGFKGWGFLFIYLNLFQFNGVEAKQAGIKVIPSEMMILQEHCFFQKEKTLAEGGKVRLQSVCVNKDSEKLYIKLNTTGTDLSHHAMEPFSDHEGESEKKHVKISDDLKIVTIAIPLDNDPDQEFWVGITDEKHVEEIEPYKKKEGEGNSSFLGHAIGAVVMVAADSFTYFIGLSSILGSKKEGMVASATKPFDYILLASSIKTFDGVQQSFSEQLGSILSHAGTASVVGLSSWAAYRVLNRMRCAGIGYVPMALASYLLSPAVTHLAKSIRASTAQAIYSFGGDPDIASTVGQAVTAGIMWTAALGVGVASSDIAVKLWAPGLGVGAGYQTIALFNQVLGKGVMTSLAGFLASYGLSSANAENFFPELSDSLLEASAVTVVEVTAEDENRVLGVSMLGVFAFMLMDYFFPSSAGSGMFAKVQKNTFSAMTILAGFGIYQHLYSRVWDFWQFMREPG